MANIGIFILLGHYQHVEATYMRNEMHGIDISYRTTELLQGMKGHEGQ